MTTRGSASGVGVAVEVGLPLGPELVSVNLTIAAARCPLLARALAAALKATHISSTGDRGGGNRGGDRRRRGEQGSDSEQPGPPRRGPHQAPLLSHLLCDRRFGIGMGKEEAESVPADALRLVVRFLAVGNLDLLAFDLACDLADLMSMST